MIIIIIKRTQKLQKEINFMVFKIKIRLNRRIFRETTIRIIIIIKINYCLKRQSMRK
jgi:hypothetical protein